MTAPLVEALTLLVPGMPVIFGGDRVARVSPELAAAFQAGDRLVVVQDSGALLRVPAATQTLARHAIDRARRAFGEMGQVSDQAITRFFDLFASHLADEDIWSRIRLANEADIQSAQARGRSTTRLAATEAMRRDMIAGLQTWRDMETGRGRVLERVDHAGWSVEQVTAPLGVIGFVFEGRPNVFADATGVLRTGNCVVFRIGSDALGTARAIVSEALDPALSAAGLPAGAAVLIESVEHAAGWAMFSDPRLALAVARGSGPAVAQLGAIARQAGVPVSLHGTGGAWMVADASADPDRLEAAIFHSLDRKVCNTLNVCCLPRSALDRLQPALLRALEAAGARRSGIRLHVLEGSAEILPSAWFDRRVQVERAQGAVEEPLADLIPQALLAHEWEWEATPELSLVLVEDTAEAISLFHAWSPHFTVSLIAGAPEAHQAFYEAIDAPFVGDGFTRWVDGQFAFNRPELGLSNWEHGRLFARGGVLGGDGVFSVRTRVRQSDLTLDRNPDTLKPA